MTFLNDLIFAHKVEIAGLIAINMAIFLQFQTRIVTSRSDFKGLIRRRIAAWMFAFFVLNCERVIVFIADSVR